MKSLFKYIMLWSSITFSVTLMAQGEVKSITFPEFYTDFQRCQSWYTATSYSVNVNYKSFVSYTTSEVEDEFDGYIYQQNENMKMFSMGVITVINDHIVFAVDTSEATIMIGDLKKVEKQTEDEKKEEELTHLEQIQSDIKSVSKKETPSGYRYEVVYEAGTEYERVIIEMNKQYQLMKQVFFFPEQIDPEDNSKSKPRMEVFYKGFSTDVKFGPKEFNEQEYFVKGAKGYLGVGKYKVYEVFDTRVK